MDKICGNCANYWFDIKNCWFDKTEKPLEADTLGCEHWNEIKPIHKIKEMLDLFYANKHLYEKIKASEETDNQYVYVVVKDLFNGIKSVEVYGDEELAKARAEIKQAKYYKRPVRYDFGAKVVLD